MTRALLACLLITALSATAARAGNWSILNRYFQPGPSKHTHSQGPCGDCQMSWQPVQSVMHPVVQPPGMWRASPLTIPRPWLMPPTPSFGDGWHGPDCRHCR